MPVLGISSLVKNKPKMEQQPEPKVEQQPGKSWITEPSLIIPLAIFIAYIWSLFQVIGFYNYFSVPADFISLNPTTVLSVSRGYYILLAFILFCIFVANLLVRFVEDVSAENPTRRFYLSLALASWV